MTVQLSRIDELALMTFDRPEVLIALNFELLRDLGAAIDQVAGGDARALLVTGAGSRAFCAGADVKELMDRSLAATRQGAALGQAIFAKLDVLPIPSIALINGYAFGGGLELALACTFRIALPGARLGLPEIKRGLIPGYGGTQRLPRLIGEARALEMILTGRTVMAEEALRIGLVNRVVPVAELAAATRALAEKIAAGPPLALRLDKQALNRAASTDLASALEVEALSQGIAVASDDHREGVAAFFDKRPPKFSGA
jgi:enoyl-CoA hydratase